MHKSDVTLQSFVLLRNYTFKKQAGAANQITGTKGVACAHPWPPPGHAPAGLEEIAYNHYHYYVLITQALKFVFMIALRHIVQ